MSIKIQQEFKDGELELEVLTVVTEGVTPEKYNSEIEIRAYDGESEGVGIAISISTNETQLTGDYYPVGLNKDETHLLIKFLKKQYATFP